MLPSHVELLPAQRGFPDKEWVSWGLPRPSLLHQDIAVHLLVYTIAALSISKAKHFTCWSGRALDPAQGLVDRHASAPLPLMLPASLHPVASAPPL